MTKSEILKAAEMCRQNNESCEGCPLYGTVSEECAAIFANCILTQEKEPAPPEGDTGSKEKYSQEYNTALLENCQAKIGRTLDFMAEMCEDLGDVDKTLWNMGKAARMLEEIREVLR